jgi:hypothetical protein
MPWPGEAERVLAQAHFAFFSPFLTNIFPL